MQGSKHTFSFFYDDFSQLTLDDLCVDDARLVHRWKHVLRLDIGDKVVLFDRFEHGAFEIEKFQGKSKCYGKIVNKSVNQKDDKHIVFLLPILKNDALSEVVYNLVESGISEIQLIATSKTPSNVSAKHKEKLQKIIHAAAEQSKFYSFPVLNNVLPLADALEVYQSSQKFYFDVDGELFNDWRQKIVEHEKTVLLAGPEGDLSHDEKKMVKDAGFVFCALTKTVLRSVRAICLGATLFRL